MPDHELVTPHETEDFGIVWKPADEQLAERFFVPGYDGMLPFFVSGNELLEMKSGGVVLTEKHLLIGILYGLHEFDHSPKAWHRADDRDTLTHLLDVLGNGSHFESPEQMLLDCAASLRERNGSRASRIVLLNGIDLVPFSSQIRSDLICDTWSVAAVDNNLELLVPIPEWVRETTLSSLIPQAAEVICYYGLCALILLRDAGLEDFLEEFVYANVDDPFLKRRIMELLERPGQFSIADLELDRA